MTGGALNPDLAAYLEEVTAPFPEDSAARIRMDLTGHVLDALEAQDEPEAESVREALASLGPADEVRRSLEAQFFTRADLAWLAQDRPLRRALAAGLGTVRPRPVWVSVLGVLLGVAVLTFLICGWPGVPSPLGRAFSWSVPTALLLELTVAAWGDQLLRRRPDRSAAVLRRAYGTLASPVWFALNLVLFAPGVTQEPGLLVAALGSSLIVTYLLRPREALALAGKAWRGAQ